MKLIDITGQKFGRLTVVRQIKSRTDGGSLWLCACECGSECERVGYQLRVKGRTPSCGCYRSEWGARLGSDPAFIAKRAASRATHGNKKKGAATPEYKTWLRIKSRCYRPTDKDYPGWGGRGIGVCDEWRNDFAAFLRDMGPMPNQQTIDRLDPNADYSPSNCRWATSEQQGGENRRGFISVTVGGVTFSKLADACRHFGVSPTTLNERLKSGIPIDEAFTVGRLKPRRTKESYLRKDKR